MYINSEYWLSTDHISIASDTKRPRTTSGFLSVEGKNGYFESFFFFCKVLHINDVGNRSDYPQKTKSNNQNRLHDGAVLNTSSFDDWAKFDS